MIWHIFKKDWKLTWWMVLGAALLYAMRVVALSRAAFVNARTSAEPNVGYVLTTLSMVATALLVVIIVQKDAIAGLRQDWLVRPIERTDLLLSKLAFVVLLVQGPIFVLDIAEGLAGGLGIVHVVAAAASRSVWTLATMVLPLIAFAALTRNLMEAIGAGFAVGLAFGLLQSATVNTSAAIAERSGIGWILSSMQSVCVLLFVLAILGLQYYRRKVIASRWICGAAVVAAFAIQFVPWQQVFAIQERFSSNPGAASAIQVHSGSGGGADLNGTSDNQVFLMVPVMFSGVGLGERVVEDRVSARIIEPSGEVTRLTDAWGSVYPVSSSAQTVERLYMPKELVGPLKRHPVRMEMDLSLTLMKPGSEKTMPADGTAELGDGRGRCALRTNFEASQVEVRCRVAGKVPCALWQLHEATGKTGHSPRFDCNGDYSPWKASVESGAISAVNMNLPFRFGPRIGDPEMEPADEADMKGAQVFVQTWEPVAHFTRQLVIPDFRLGKRP